jgi:hypothetical protein
MMQATVVVAVLFAQPDKVASTVSASRFVVVLSAQPDKVASTISAARFLVADSAAPLVRVVWQGGFPATHSTELVACSPGQSVTTRSSTNVTSKRYRTGMSANRTATRINNAKLSAIAFSIMRMRAATANLVVFQG